MSNRRVKKIYCGTCGRNLALLQSTAAGFGIRARDGIRMRTVIERGEARFLLGCWCPGKRSADEKVYAMRSYVMTMTALQLAWEAEAARIMLGDAALAGTIR